MVKRKKLKRGSYIKRQREDNKLYTGDFLSTGSTPLNVTISGTALLPDGGINYWGGLPGGIIIEIWGPPGSGKTSLALEILSYAKLKGGRVLFVDIEGRLKLEFAKSFAGLELDEDDEYKRFKFVDETFEYIDNWFDFDQHGASWQVIAGDSLASLTTRRALDPKNKQPEGLLLGAELNTGLNKLSDTIARKKAIVIWLNQQRDVVGATQFQSSKKSTGGNALPHYASLRLRVSTPELVRKEITFKGSKVKRVKAIRPSIQVIKSSVDVPWRQCDVTMQLNYGIMDITDCLLFLKKFSNKSEYHVGKTMLGKKLPDAVMTVAKSGKLEDRLKKEFVKTWHIIESKFKEELPPKRRE